MATKDPWEWLSLVDANGPFLSRAALKSVFPNGLDRPYNAIDDINSTFVYEHTLWSKAWTARQGRLDPTEDLAWRNRWVTAVLRDLLQWGDYLDEHPDPTIVASSPDGDVAVRPWAALDAGEGPVALVVVVDPTDDLRRTGADGWAADAIDRTAALLREAKVSIGLVTDGRWWGIVSAVRDVTTASGVFDSLIWREERDSRDAFLALAGLVSLAGGSIEKRLPRLFELSVASAEAITEALGDQVRRAVELVLQAMSESHLRASANGGESPLPDDSKQVYEAAVSVLMRVVFLLFAEERALLPQHQMYRDSYAISGVRAELERHAQNVSEEVLDHTWETWHRLLAASSAIYSGATFEDTRMPAYGGSLFDPSRFAWLHSTNAQGQLSVRVSDRVMLRVLKAVQIADVGGEARGLSFRDLDVEQIGYVYEGLLGYTAEYTTEVVVGLQGRGGYEPEIALSDLLTLCEAAGNGAGFAKKFLAHLKKTQPNAKPATAVQIAKAFEADDETKAAEARSRLGYLLFGRADLVDLLVPLHALIRRDLRDFPYVVPAGGIVMIESPQRANTGTHYTPRSLAEEVVHHALAPLVYSPGPFDTESSDDWVLKSSTEILSLKVADIAAGSGAFLVAAARYLAERLVESHTKEGLAAESDDVRRWAIREVAARCLYGADVNSMAVEMCKLSLWLVSMDPSKPFSFVDDRVFLGNSLLGLTTERQLRAQHIDPSQSKLRQTKLLQLDVESDLARVAQLRRELSSGQADDADRMRSTRAKRKMLKESREITARLRDVADGIIAAGLCEGGKPGKALEARYAELADALFEAYPLQNAGDRTRLDVILSAGLTPEVDTGETKWKPLHWVLEAPDVTVHHGGFDAVIGNPPFLGGKKVSGATGVSMREWFVNQLAGGTKGNTDLAAFFFLRAQSLLNESGTLGLVATNTIAQGDTREVGLDQMIDSGFEIYRAIQSKAWPARSAQLEYAAVWGSRSPNRRKSDANADGIKCASISSLLEPEGAVRGLPARLPENLSRAFMGSNLNGGGFVIPRELGESMIRVDPRSTRVLKRYVRSNEVNGSPNHESAMYVIDFGTMPIDDARSFELPFDHLQRMVKPHRDQLGNKPKLQQEWWLFERRAEELYSQIRNMERVVSLVQTSKTQVPVFLNPKHAVFSHKIVVVATESYGLFAAMSSAFHFSWILQRGSSMKADPVYTPTDVFQTFPFPEERNLLITLGERLDFERREIMSRRILGLTSLYNLVNSPEIIGDADVDRIRSLHVQIDEAVRESYGWVDIELDHGFHTYRQVERYTVSPAARVEILDRLLEENHRRAAQQAQNGGRALAPTELKLDPKTAPEGAMF